MLPAGANQQIHLRGAAPIDFREDAAERFRRKLGDFVEAAGSVKDGVAGGVVNRETKMQPGSASGGGFGIGDGLAQRGGQAIAAADDAQAHALFDAVGGFGEQVFVEQAQDGVDFGGGALPVRGGKREERERVNADARRGFDDAARGFGSGAMTCGTRQAARRGPASVAIGNDGDVQALTRRSRALRSGSRSRGQWPRSGHRHSLRRRRSGGRSTSRDRGIACR